MSNALGIVAPKTQSTGRSPMLCVQSYSIDACLLRVADVHLLLVVAAVLLLGDVLGDHIPIDHRARSRSRAHVVDGIGSADGEGNADDQTKEKTHMALPRLGACR